MNVDIQTIEGEKISTLQFRLNEAGLLIKPETNKTEDTEIDIKSEEISSENNIRNEEKKSENSQEDTKNEEEKSDTEDEQNINETKSDSIYLNSFQKKLVISLRELEERKLVSNFTVASFPQVSTTFGIAKEKKN